MCVGMKCAEMKRKGNDCTTRNGMGGKGTVRKSFQRIQRNCENSLRSMFGKLISFILFGWDLRMRCVPKTKWKKSLCDRIRSSPK